MHPGGANQRIEKRLKDLRDREIFRDVCPILKTPEEAAQTRPLCLDFVKDAIFPFDRDRFFECILDRLKRRLLGSVRRQMDKIRHWDLKPDLRPREIFEL